MTKLFCLFLLSAFSCMLHAQDKVIDLPYFHGVAASAGVKAELIESDHRKVEIYVKKGDAEDLKVKVSNDILKLSWHTSSSWGKKRSMHVKVYFTDLELIKASSGSHISNDQCISIEELELDCSSGAYLALDLDCTDLVVDVSSGASVNLVGSANSQNVDVSSGASYKSPDLICKSATVEASSGAFAKVYATEYFKGRASSGGAIRYGGNPIKVDVKKDKWSGGSVSKL